MLLERKDRAAPGQRGIGFGIEQEGAVEARQSQIVLLATEVNVGAIIGCGRVVGIEFDRLVKVRHGAIVVVFCGIGDAAIVERQRQDLRRCLGGIDQLAAGFDLRVGRQAIALVLASLLLWRGRFLRQRNASHQQRGKKPRDISSGLPHWPIPIRSVTNDRRGRGGDQLCRGIRRLPSLVKL